jgi:formylmethanofuran dehydrogenase subunit E
MKNLTTLILVLGAATLADASGSGPLGVEEALAAAFAPEIEVVDTVSSLGPLADDPQRVTLVDLVRFHGHPCDGLVVAAAGMTFGLRELFPGSAVDRTDIAVVVNRSACYGDVAAYLTGARHRYGSLVVDPKLGDEWILRRRSTGTAVRVLLRPGIKPPELPALERQLKEPGCPADLIARVQQLQRSFALAVLSRSPAEIFEVATIEPQDEFPGMARPDTLKRECPSITQGQ